LDSEAFSPLVNQAFDKKNRNLAFSAPFDPVGDLFDFSDFHQALASP
jgi:hypothetical protein